MKFTLRHPYLYSMNSDSKTLVSFGEIMMRMDCTPGERFHRTESFRRFFGGAESNVAVVLSQLGINARYVTALPANDLGQAAIDAVRSFGVDTSFVHRGGERMGIYFTEHGNNIRASRVIYDRKYSSFASLVPGTLDWDRILEGASYFFWSGIAAALTQNAADVCREAILAARSKGLTVIADMNYRRTLWNYGKHPSEIMPELLSHCQFIGGDIDTIAVYFGIKEGAGNYEDKFRFCTSELKKKLPAMQALTMSFRGTDQYNQPTYSGALWWQDQYYFSPSYSLPETIDRIGSGDAFEGGLLYALINELPGQDIINFAVACGAIKHSMEGDFCILSKEEVQQFIRDGAVNRVIR
ncbi:MAG: sugar kinase [Pirellulales bacterium]